MKKLIIICAIALFVVSPIVGAATGWLGTWFNNEVDYVNQKIDDATNYETRKEVEDSCRAMVASYEADKLTYEQYKNSKNAEHQSWAAQAKMRANRTAANYNNYVLKNSYVWDGNIPEDITEELKIIE